MQTLEINLKLTCTDDAAMNIMNTIGLLRTGRMLDINEGDGANLLLDAVREAVTERLDDLIQQDMGDGSTEHMYALDAQIPAAYWKNSACVPHWRSDELPADGDAGKGKGK